MSHSWLSTDVSANRCINTYLKGFLDISGGDLYLRHGQMGIGTTNPTYPLDVSGGIYSNSTASIGNISIGYMGYGNFWTGLANTAAINSSANNYAILQHNDGSTLINAASGKNIGFRIANNDKITVTSTGRFGIGTTAPTYPLEVTTSTFISAFTHSFLLRNPYNNAVVVSTNTIARDVSIYATNSIWTNEVLMSSSDERIKTNIQEISDDNALSTLRLIQPKTYEYKEHIARGNHTTYGFIAQQIKEVIPHAVSLHSKSIPNIYTIAEVSATNEIYNVITFTDFDTANLDVSSNSIVVMDMENKEHDVTITDVIDSNSIRVDTDLSEWMGDVDASGNIIDQGTKIFVYGQKVDDFHTLHKDAIFTVATAALQEVDRQLQAEKSKTVALETKVATMESQITDLLARVTALESA